MKHKTMMVIALGVAVMMSGCMSSRSGRMYSRSEARRAQTVENGTVERVERVTIEGTKTPIGAVAGGVMGGVLGSAVGGGSGKRIATAAGALGGAAAGAAGEEALTRKAGLEIQVKMDSGNTVVVVQEADEVFAPGERVRVITTADGTKRVRH